jgi:FkbM family methyltransferase
MLRLALLAEATSQQRRAVDLTDTVSAETEAGALYLPRADRYVTPTLVETGVWEEQETAFLREHLRPGATFLDIGAHVGYFSCLAGRLVGPRGLVVAFEPNPRNYELLLANLWRNRLGNAVAFPWAVSDSTGFADLYLDAANTGNHRLAPLPDSGEQAVSVRTVALDELAVLRPPVDVVKIDTQGYDDLVLRGMPALLAQSPDAVLLVEFWPFGIRLREEDPQAVLDYCRGLGYQVAVQIPGRPGRPGPLGDEEILEYCAGEGGELHVNLLLTRR